MRKIIPSSFSRKIVRIFFLKKDHSIFFLKKDCSIFFLKKDCSIFFLEKDYSSIFFLEKDHSIFFLKKDCSNLLAQERLFHLLSWERSFHLLSEERIEKEEMWRRQAMLSIHKSTLSTHWSSNIFSRSLSFDANQSYITSSRLPFNMSPHAIASFTLHAATSTFITATACYSAEHCWNQSKKTRDLWLKDQIMPMRVVYSVFGSTAGD